MVEFTAGKPRPSRRRRNLTPSDAGLRHRIGSDGASATQGRPETGDRIFTGGRVAAEEFDLLLVLGLPTGPKVMAPGEYEIGWEFDTRLHFRPPAALYSEAHRLVIYPAVAGCGKACAGDHRVPPRRRCDGSTDCSRSSAERCASSTGCCG